MSSIPNEVWLCAFGVFAHLISVLSEISTQRNTLVTPPMYIRERPYKFLLSVIGAVIGYLLLLQVGELTLLTAFGAGYISNDSTDRIGRIAAAKMG